MKHTPAPWTAQGTRIKAGDFEILLGTTIGAPKEEWDANAALIAAAPELLEALKEAYKYINGGSERQHGLAFQALFDQVRAAISKAGGAVVRKHNSEPFKHDAPVNPFFAGAERPRLGEDY